MPTYSAILIILFYSFYYRFSLKKSNSEIPYVFSDGSFFKEKPPIKKIILVLTIIVIAFILILIILIRIFGVNIEPNLIVIMFVFLSSSILIILCIIYLCYYTFR